MVTGRTVVNTVRYKYNSDDQMTSKVITPASGSAFTYYFTHSDNNTSVQFAAGGRTITSHSKTDSFGRKIFDELQLGTDFVTRQFTYHAGQVTEEHQDNAKLKSAATTQLVSQIVLSDGRTLSYEYDAEERITKVTDSFEGTTEYTYDALGQLLTETVDGVVVNSMVYDNYGNILSKNGVAYEYCDDAWKDKLTAVGDDAIEYDAQGNPTIYLGHTLTWEKGRQLKSFDNITYTYNANGIRTSKTVNGVKHTYTLDGTKILRETWVSNTLIPLYDNEDTVCGIIYNNTPYYFLKNLQGDVIAIVNQDGDTVARYSYDVWGKCTVNSDTSGCSIATINPYRYRGYYYDQEIDLYYLQSRYYDATVGRFVNSDEVGLMRCLGMVCSYDLFTYCNNTSVNMTDPLGYKSVKTYSGVVGFGVQILFSANVLCYQGFIGVEALWFAFTKNNNFKNGLVPWCYWFAGGSIGITLDFNEILSKSFLNNPKNILKGFGLGFSISIGVTFFLITAKRMEGPKDYTRSFTFSSITTWGITVSKASGSNISTYGVGYSKTIGAEGTSIGKLLFGTAKGASYYWALPINRNAKELYSLVESKV